ncbi:hypothetical protein B0T17DRAFT_522142 [Bombardia bombarda]|uniref:holo-[acyl-carrier-protein] synthase n=1 Tax=Bombardia bombarda TaxID=252184 RepID=A0AA39X7K8_9PEZI|nr:hypothetical protein B0T17DRAFT_522142 [Bombardia bombarda]
MAATTQQQEQPVLVQWILDTRSWYPQATQTRQLESHAARALALLTPDERAGVLRYYHVRDAKMALASALIKHYTIAKLVSDHGNRAIPWSDTAITRDARTKPIWRDPLTSDSPIAFNVTHQAGIVAIVAVVSPGCYSSPTPTPTPLMEIQVGVDIVCTSERRDRDQRMVRDEGWGYFVDMHADVFAVAETTYLKYQVLSAVPGLAPPRGAPVEAVVDAKLRAFYALWALREAYVKLNGEALLADWLKELEFRYFRPPCPTAGWEVAAAEGEVGAEAEADDAQVIRNIEIRFRGKRVDDVNICLRSIGPDYMICTAVRTPEDKAVALGWRLGAYETLELGDVLDFAESRSR